MSQANWRRKAGTVILAGWILTGAGNTAAEPVDDPEDLAVRSTDVSVADLIERAARESPTFRSMMDAVRASKGIVYIQPGKCGHGVRSCLVDVVPAGARRILRAKVDVKKRDAELMASIGHELRHALEVLSDPSIKSSNAMFHYYHRTATMGAGRTFETRAAIQAGDAVGREIREFRRREGAR
jgi:hypothetical protein